jgi:hypothetical protein
MVLRMESGILGTVTGTATLDDDNFIEAAEPDTANTDTDTFTVAGHGLTHFRGTLAASLAFSMRIHLHGPLMSLIGGRTS